MQFSHNEIITMIQMDKDVITAIINHISNTHVINGYNEGQLKEARLEVDRLHTRIIDKALLMDDISFLQEQKLYLRNVKDQLNNIDKVVLI